jgi:hypothetical protein
LRIPTQSPNLLPLPNLTARSLVAEETLSDSVLLVKLAFEVEEVTLASGDRKSSPTSFFFFFSS